MRIISKPDTTCKCGRCLTVMEYDNSDVRHRTEPPGYDEYEHRDVYFIKCPTCNAEIRVNATPLQKELCAKPSFDD